ncbi:MAG: hypothetical protein RDV48_12850 [Candidatus Eremiobacteraeota bacterium]|nr:hypothetical protein [Candidatus Eremiobacteraeota bacterium]
MPSVLHPSHKEFPLLDILDLIEKNDLPFPEKLHEDFMEYWKILNRECEEPLIIEVQEIDLISGIGVVNSLGEKC